MKAYFLSRLLREKILLVAFAVVLALIWVSSATKRAGALWRSYANTSTDLDDQKIVLSQQKQIAARAKSAIAVLDATKTIDRLRLPGEIYSIANNAGVSNPIIGDGGSDSTGQFAIHTVQVTIRNIEYPRLKTFYMRVSDRAPYMGIEQMSIQSNRANTAMLNVSLKVASVEILH